VVKPELGSSILIPGWCRGDGANHLRFMWSWAAARIDLVCDGC
jgi:hypothetical protein